MLNVFVGGPRRKPSLIPLHSYSDSDYIRMKDVLNIDVVRATGRTERSLGSAKTPCMGLDEYVPHSFSLRTHVGVRATFSEIFAHHRVYVGFPAPSQY
jgi:hypothetical protein